MMSVDRPGKRQTFKPEDSPHISHMLKKDKGETIQEQEETEGQEQEYSYSDGYRYDNYSRWEKVTSYTPPKKPKSSKGIGIASALTLFVIVAGIIGWPVMRKAAVTPLPGNTIAVTTAVPNRMATPVLSTDATLYTYHGHSKNVFDVAWSPRGGRIASASDDGTVQVWGATTGANVVVHRGIPPSYSTLAWSPDGRCIASASVGDTTIEIWDVLTGKTVYTYQLQAAAAEIPHIGALSMYSGGCGTGVYKVAWSPDGTRLVAAGGYQTHGIAEVFDAKTGNRLLTYTAHASCVGALAWSPNGKYIASGSFDGALNVWDTMIGHTAYAYTTAGTNDGIESLVWSPDNQHIALSTGGLGMHIWDPFNGQTITFDRDEQVFQLAWSPEGQRIASASPDRTVRIWDVTTDNLLYLYRGHTDEVFTVAWSPDGHMLASAGMDNTVQIWRF
jgi:WD40 repeat protein